MRRQIVLLGAALAIPVAALTVISSPPPCHLQVIRDYDVGVMYRAVLRRSPGCPYGTLLRVRKTSTTSTKSNGAPYQPIKPLIGAWEIGEGFSNVPKNELWSLNSWRWEYWKAAGKDSRPGGFGVWLPAEVVRYAHP